MRWSHSIPTLSHDALRTLTAWSTGKPAGPLLSQGDQFEPPDIPGSVIDSGPTGVLDYAIANLPETDAGRYWTALDDKRDFPDSRTAREISRSFFDATNWRPGFAISALRALDTRSVWDTDGILLGLEVARGILTRASTVAMIKLAADLADGGNLDTPLESHHSPFSDPVVQETLAVLDEVVAAQERQEDRGPQVLADMQRFGPEPLELVKQAQQRFPLLAATPGPAGSYVTTLLRALMEDALVRQELDLIKRIDRVIITIASRYGFTKDVLHAAERCAITNAMVYADMATGATVSTALEHFLVGALWLADSELLATVHHGLALVLRSGSRKVPGLLDAVSHMQRAISLRKQNNEVIQAYGSQIDLTSILLNLSQFAGNIADAPLEVVNWDTASKAYLEDAIYHLSKQQDPTSKLYLGEAFFNRSMLYQKIGCREAAAENAQAALEIAEETKQKDLEARARKVLAGVETEPERALDHLAAASRLVQAVRRNIDDEDITVGWVGNKEGLFSAQLDFILDKGRQIMTEEAVCEALCDALEFGRGLTYNRWLGVSKNVDAKNVRELLDENPEVVLAVYAITSRQAALVLLTARETPRLHLFNLGSAAVDRMVENHLNGLNQQGWTFVPMWDEVQAEYLKAAIPLVAPLETYIADGKSICFIPHRTLHSANLHAVPTKSGGIPIGLRTPVFSNPSLTNWCEAQRAAKATLQSASRTACVASACPTKESEYFDDVSAVAKHLRAAGFHISELHEGAANLDNIANSGQLWMMLHLACHGVFREKRGISGLMLSAEGQPPPPPLGDVSDKMGNLATPKRLREARLAGRITFLTSCVSARNVELPGDDLMGITRALFGSGAVALIAGSWTVVSRHVQPFTEEFYMALVNGRTTAEAMLLARQRVAKDHPDPFFWGCFINQGANAHLTKTGV